MKISFLSIAFIMVICVQTETVAQVAPKYTNEFLAIGVGARAFGMSNSAVASARDITAAYWNPAALLSLEDNLNIGIMHSEYFAGLAQYDFGALGFKIDDQSNFAVSLIRFGVDNIPNTLELIDSDGRLRFDRIKAFSVADYAVTFSYARELPVEGLSVGGNAKIIRRVGGDFARAWGFGIDLGGRYIMGNWTFALMARDITTTYNSWTFNTKSLKDVFIMTGNEIPENSTEITLPEFIPAVSYTYAFNDKFEILGEVDMDISTDGKRNVLIKGDPFSIDPHLGIECNYKKLVYLRAGIGNIQNEFGIDGKKFTTVQPNIGLGIKYKKLTLDYALTDIGNVSVAGYSHVFSLNYSINKINMEPIK